MANLAKETLSLLNNQISGTSADHEHDQLRLEVRQLRQAALQSNAERSELMSQLEQLKQLLSDSDQAAALALDRQVDTAVNRVRAEFTMQVDNLRSHIEKLTRTIDEKDGELSQLAAQLEETRRSLRETDQAAAIALEFQVSTAIGQSRQEFTVQIEKLNCDLEQLAEERDQAKQELAAVCQRHDRVLAETERAAAVAFERDKAFAIESARSELKAESERFRQELQRRFDDASNQWDHDRAQLLAERDNVMLELAAARDQYQHELAEAERLAANVSQRDRAENEKLRQKLSQVLTAFELERAELVAERDRASRALTEQAEQNSQVLSETRDAAERDKAAAIESVRNQLRAETEKLRQEMQQQLAQIVTDTRQTTLADLALDLQDTPDTTPGSVRKENPISGSIRAEIARVEGLIRSISEVIEDEATELSVVIRKNAERSELESYLKGIRFSISE